LPRRPDGPRSRRVPPAELQPRRGSTTCTPRGPARPPDRRLRCSEGLPGAGTSPPAPTSKRGPRRRRGRPRDGEVERPRDRLGAQRASRPRAGTSTVGRPRAPAPSDAGAIVVGTTIGGSRPRPSSPPACAAGTPPLEGLVATCARHAGGIGLTRAHEPR
jgi:hypothetical protein